MEENKKPFLTLEFGLGVLSILFAIFFWLNGNTLVGMVFILFGIGSYTLYQRKKKKFLEGKRNVEQFPIEQTKNPGTPKP